ncbi:MAG: hypothetical protein JEZ00_11400 [Anaerolineaceae bacterium]|nr:hypothetical protein [Anaerolineaceae bacterium]
MNQRDKMRELFSRFGNQPEILIREYAAAERRGEVKRKNNLNGMPPEDYAYYLLADARNKGWLPGLN